MALDEIRQWAKDLDNKDAVLASHTKAKDSACAALGVIIDRLKAQKEPMSPAGMTALISDLSMIKDSAFNMKEMPKVVAPPKPDGPSVGPVLAGQPAKA